MDAVETTSSINFFSASSVYRLQLCISCRNGKFLLYIFSAGVALGHSIKLSCIDDFNNPGQLFSSVSRCIYFFLNDADFNASPLPARQKLPFSPHRNIEKLYSSLDWMVRRSWSGGPNLSQFGAWGVITPIAYRLYGKSFSADVYEVSRDAVFCLQVQLGALWLFAFYTLLLQRWREPLIWLWELGGDSRHKPTLLLGSSPL